MKKYELTFLTPQELKEEEVKILQEKLTALITKKNGTVAEFQKAFKKKLAYPVKKKQAAYVNTVIFDLDPKDLDMLKKEINDEPKILRSFFLIHKPITQRELSRRPTRIDIASKEKKKEGVEVAKPWREKPKAELNEIEEKLNEILKQ